MMQDFSTGFDIIIDQDAQKVNLDDWQSTCRRRGEKTKFFVFDQSDCQSG